MKLVRDRIGDIPGFGEAAKRHLGHVEVGSHEYRQLLLKKLHEEVSELTDAFLFNGPGQTLAEAADVYEVLLALLVARGWGDRLDPRNGAEIRLDQAAEEKFIERGGFFEGRTFDGAPATAGSAEAGAARTSVSLPAVLSEDG